MLKVRPSENDMTILVRLSRAYRLTTAALESEVLSISTTATKHRLDRLCGAGFLEKKKALVRLFPSGMTPVCRWDCGKPQPDFGALSYHLCKRWGEIIPRWEQVYWITPKSLALLAMPRRKAYVIGQASHDLGVFRMWQWAMSAHPKLDFVGEDVFANERTTGEIVEDAQLHSNGKLVAILEFGGAYRVERLEEIHTAIAETKTPYVLF
jgi:hypothetical protein